MLTAFMSWLIFGRVTMARIEASLKEDGISRPCPWDGPGARIVWYAWAIAMPVGRLNQLDDPLIDVDLVRRYSRPSDRIIAVVMLFTTAVWLLVGFLGAWLFDFY